MQRNLAVLILCVLFIIVSNNIVFGAEMNLQNPCRLILPDKIYAVVGKEINIYFNNIVITPNIRNFVFDVACNKGVLQEERWTYIPKAEDAGDFNLTITVLDINYKPIAKAATTIKVIPVNTAEGKNINLLCIGDSLTHESIYTQELLDLCETPSNPSITMFGTHHVSGTSENNRHEGYGGWTFDKFANFYSTINDPNDYGKRCSPFVFMENGKPTLDFKRYVNEQCGGKKLDVVTIYLGVNDITWSDDSNIEQTIDAAFANADKLIQSISKASPDTIIGLVMMVPPSASQDAFGNNYGCSIKRWISTRSHHRFLERMKTSYSNKEKDKIYLIPAYVNLDTINGVLSEVVPANSRSTTKIIRQSNADHPSESGYKQMADSIYYWMKSILK